jgi:hypothetical protein
VSTLRRWLARFFGSFARDQADRELNDEFHAHLQLEIDDLVRRGRSAAEARRAGSGCPFSAHRCMMHASSGARWRRDGPAQSVGDLLTGTGAHQNKASPHDPDGGV